MNLLVNCPECFAVCLAGREEETDCEWEQCVCVTYTGSVHTFEMGMKEFAELRCSTALALRECRRIHDDEGLKRVEQLGTRRQTYVQS